MVSILGELLADDKAVALYCTDGAIVAKSAVNVFLSATLSIIGPFTRGSWSYWQTQNWIYA